MGKVELLDNREIQKNRSLIVACLVLFLFLKIPAKRGISMFAIGEEKHSGDLGGKTSALYLR